MHYLCHKCNFMFSSGGQCPVCGGKLKEQEKELRFLEPDLIVKPSVEKKELAEKYGILEENFKTVYVPFWNISVHMDQHVVYTLETIKDGLSSMKTAFVHVSGGFVDRRYETVSGQKALLGYLKQISFEKAEEFHGLEEGEAMVLAEDQEKQKGNDVPRILADLLTELGEESEELKEEGRPVCDTMPGYDLEDCSVVLIPVYIGKEKGRRCILDAQTGEMISDNKPRKRAIKIQAAVFFLLTFLYGIVQYFLHYQLAVTVIYILLVLLSAMLISIPEDAMETVKEQEKEPEMEFDVIEIVEGQKELSYFME